MSKASTIRVPKDLSDKIDGYIEKGYYLSRSDFVTSAVRFTLIYYAELRGIFSQLFTDSVNKYSDGKPPRPIMTYDEYLDYDEESFPNMATPSEDQYVQNYYSVTLTFLTYYEKFKGKPVQIGFSYPDGLRQRVRTLNKTKYGFSRKMDFVRVSIVCLLLKTFETDFLYDDMERYGSEMQNHSLKIMSNMFFDYLFSGDMAETISDAIEGIFGDDEEDDELDDLDDIEY